jgi:CBS domain-containing membrane protein
MEVKSLVRKKMFTASDSSTLRDVWTIIFQKEVNAVPVLDRKRHIVGIVSREDILHTLYPDYQEYVDELLSSNEINQPSKKIREILSFPVKKIMQKNVIFCRLDTPVMRALARMIARRIDQLPVLNEKNTLVGVVSKKDIFNVLYRTHRKMFSFSKR